MKKIILIISIIISLSIAFSCDMLAFLNRDISNPLSDDYIYNSEINSLVTESTNENINGWGYSKIGRSYNSYNSFVDFHTTTAIQNDPTNIQNLKDQLKNGYPREGTIIHARKATVNPEVGGVHPFLWKKGNNIGERSISFAHNGSVPRSDIFNLLYNDNYEWFQAAYAHVNDGAQLPNLADSFVDSELAFYLMILNYEKYQDIKSAMFMTIYTIKNFDYDAIFNFILMEGRDHIYAYRHTVSDSDHRILWSFRRDLFILKTFGSGNVLSPGQLVEFHSGATDLHPIIYNSFANQNLPFSRNFVQGCNYISFPVLKYNATIGQHFSDFTSYIDSIQCEDGTTLTGANMLNHVIDKTKGMKIFVNQAFSTIDDEGIGTEKGIPTDPTKIYALYTGQKYYIPSGQQYYIPYIKKQYRNTLPPTHRQALGQAIYDNFSYMSPSPGISHCRTKPGSSITSMIKPYNAPNPTNAKNGSMYIIKSFKNVCLQWDGNSWVFETRKTKENNDIIFVDVKNVTNYPNPFNPETTINFNMSKAGKANVSVYNLKGQLVKTILNDNVATGNQSVVWNGTDTQNNSVASGVYFYRIKTNNQTINKKMVLQK